MACKTQDIAGSISDHFTPTLMKGQRYVLWSIAATDRQSCVLCTVSVKYINFHCA